MFKRVIFVCIALFIIPSIAIAEVKTYTHTVRQPFGGSQSPDDARVAAIAKAKGEVLELAGVYLESLTVVKENVVARDEILALAAGVLKTKIVSQKNYVTGEAFGIEITAVVDVDTSILENRVKKLLQDRTLLGKYAKAQEREKELLERIEKLEEENRKIRTLSSQEQKPKAEDLKVRFREATKGLTAVEWNKKAFALWDQHRFTNPEQALEYLEEAIRLDPKWAMAYSNRGVVYGDLGQHNRAIEDYNQAIRLDPKWAPAYLNRGVVYGELGQYHRALDDLNQALQLDPKLAMAYSNRGAAYNELGQYHRALEELKHAIRLDPNSASAYYNRGSAYKELGQYHRALEDFNQAIRLYPNYAGAYNIRGTVYGKLGQDRRELEDYNQAIRLDPKLALAYSNRGAFYYNNLGQYHRALEDYNQAIRLDPKLAMAYNNRGAVYYNDLRQYSRALDDFNEALRLDPDNTLARKNRRLALRKMSPRQQAPCFIATAAFGSPVEPHVIVLRKFRDRFLLPNSVGRAFVGIYYSYSPPIARFIATHNSLKAVVSWALLPLVGVSWVVLKIGTVYSVALIFLLCSGLVGILCFRRKLKK